MATILDIARESGYSKTLVSRALNNQKGVGEEARRKILDTSKKLNYRPNMLAKSLVLQKTQTIGVILDSMCATFFFDLIKGLQDTAKSFDYNILFCSSNEDISLKRNYLKYFTEGRTDGIIIYGSCFNDYDIIKNLYTTNFPFVVIENDVENININNVILDNELGAKIATTHLIKQGCKKVFHFTGDMDKKVSIERKNSFINTMKENGLYSNDIIIESDFSEKAGYDSMIKLIKEKRIPDGIFFSGDLTSYGAMRALIENNYKIPKDIKLVGYDYDVIESYDLLYPGLTTIRQPLYEMGQEAIKILVKHINNPKLKVVKKIMKPKLVIKQTCGKKIKNDLGNIFIEGVAYEQ